MQYKYSKIFILLSVIFLMIVTGCKKMDLSPRDRYSDLTYWETTENVNAALNNVYHWLYTSGAVINNEGLSDNAYGGGVDNKTIASGVFTPDNGRFAGEWSYYFSGLKAANVFLEGVDKNATVDNAVKERMKAEARFIRAWFHFHLTKWWGDAPIVNKDLTIEDAKTIKRSPKADVVKFITDELDAVANVLPKKEGYAAADNGRITKGAALALKARVLLYEGNRMAEVVSICEKLMNEQNTYGSYSLENNYSNLFSDLNTNKNSGEAILSLQFVPLLRTWGELFDMIPISAGARTNGLAPSQELVDSYIMMNGKAIGETGSGYNENDPYVNRDPRLTATVVYHGYQWKNPDGSTQTIYIKPGSTPSGGNSTNEYSTSGQGSATGYYWRKYYDPKFSEQSNSSGLNLHLIRYADVLLMYAEAKESLGQLNADVWNKTIKLTRQRAGFTDAGALNLPAANLKQVVRNERRSEFALEGLRVDDIRRWRIAETVMNGWLHGAKFGSIGVDNGYLRVQERKFEAPKHYLWPVPPADISKNANLLPQNPGY